MKKIRYSQKNSKGYVSTENIIHGISPRTGRIASFLIRYEPDKLICTIVEFNVEFDGGVRDLETFTGTSVRDLRKTIVDRFKAMGVNFEGEGYL